MEEELRYFVAYLENIRKASHNTVMSYHSDLTKMIAYLHGQGGLGDGTDIGRPAEVALPGEGIDIAELLQGHVYHN